MSFEVVSNNVKDIIQVSEETLFLRKGLKVEDHEVTMYNYLNFDEQVISSKGENQLQEIQFEFDKVWLRKLSGGSIYYGITDLIARETPLFLVTFIESQIALCIERNEEGKKEFVLYNFDNNECIWKHPNSSTLYSIHDNKLYFLEFKGLSRYKIICLDITNGKTIWNYSISEKDQKNDNSIEKILGFYNSQIVAGLKDGTILLIDKNSGGKIDTWETKVPSIYTAKYHQGLIVNITGVIFYKLEISKRKITTFQIDSIFSNRSIFDPSDPSKLYFISRDKSVDHAPIRLVGCLNLDDYQIEWLEKIPMSDADVVNQIKKFGQNLYALTADGLLCRKLCLT